MIAMSKPKATWTKAEIARLKLVIPDFTTWTVVQRDFPRHSAEDCRQKWFSECTSKNHGTWLAEEDERLCHAMTLTTKWPAVAAIVETRSYRQCQTRWKRMQKGCQATARNALPRSRAVEEPETTTELPPIDNAFLDLDFFGLDLSSSDLSGVLYTPCEAPPQNRELAPVESAWHAEPPQTSQTERVKSARRAISSAPTLDALASALFNVDAMNQIAQRLPATPVAEDEEDASSRETMTDEIDSYGVQSGFWLELDDPNSLMYV